MQWLNNSTPLPSVRELRLIQTYFLFDLQTPVPFQAIIVACKMSVKCFPSPTICSSSEEKNVYAFNAPENTLWNAFFGTVPLN